jgi:arabinogalactan endo-1,4-beta-galactosidase
LQTLKLAGVNTIRIRLWKKPKDISSSYAEVKAFAKEVKAKGMMVWICMHYSDTWADPGAQEVPSEWMSGGLSFSRLMDSVSGYTKQVALDIQPDYIQIGNEINNGFLLPFGSKQSPQFEQLLKTGIEAVRLVSPKTKILIHFAGYQNSIPFFTDISSLDYDIIGLSYYPTWHGRNLETLSSEMNLLHAATNKPIIIAETSYPFTLGWNDWTNNIIGDTSQILSNYPPTSLGQKEYLQRIKEISSSPIWGGGFCYWGGEWISYKGSTSKEGSSYENQALWDFNAKALPALEVFK